MKSIQLFTLVLVVVAVQGQNAIWNCDFLTRAVNSFLARAKFSFDDESPVLDRQFNDVNEWYGDFMRRWDEFLARIPSQPKDKIQGRLIEYTKKAAAQFKTQHIDPAQNYLAQGSPEAEKYMKALEARFNFFGRPRFLTEWGAKKCGTSQLWWYCGQVSQ